VFRTQVLKGPENVLKGSKGNGF